MIGRSAPALIWRARASPSMRGIMRSRSIRSGQPASRRRSASWPSRAVATSYPSWLNCSARTTSRLASSSTRRIRCRRCSSISQLVSPEGPVTRACAEYRWGSGGIAAPSPYSALRSKKRSNCFTTITPTSFKSAGVCGRWSARNRGAGRGRFGGRGRSTRRGLRTSARGGAWPGSSRGPGPHRPFPGSGRSSG